jgi:hypothetical protein
MRDHNPLDFIDLMSEMTPQELWTIKFLKDNLILLSERVSGKIKYRTTCRSIIKTSNLSSAEQQKFKKGYKRLNAKNLVKRIKRQHYILNPDFFIPHYYNEEKTMFDNVT